jgi:hypothetical protein
VINTPVRVTNDTVRWSTLQCVWRTIQCNATILKWWAYPCTRLRLPSNDRLQSNTSQYLAAPGIEPGNSGSAARKSDH